MPRRSLINFFLPLVIFPLLTACALKYMFSHVHESGLDEKLNAHCQQPPHGSPVWLASRDFLLPYTGNSEIDRQGICGLIVFFHALMDSPHPLPFIEYFAGTGAPYALFTIIEGYRKGQNFILAYPVIWLLLTQFLSYGASYPIYCLFLVLTGGIQRAGRFDAHSFTQAHAESFIFGMIVGGIIPSLTMFIVNDPFMTWIWQLYPIYISLAQILYLQIRPPSRYSRSGFSIMRLVYMGAFLISSCIHVTTVWPRRNDLKGLIQLIAPSTTLLDPMTDISIQVLHFLKWDYSLGYTALALALSWSAQNLKQLLKMMLWYTVAMPFIGIGAATMGIAMWRDGILG